MYEILLFIIVFTVIYFVYYFIFDEKIKKEKYTKISELVILCKKFNLDKKKMDYRKTLNGVAIINAFIIAFTLAIINLIPLRMEFRLLIAFVIIMVLIFTLYFAYGKYLNKKWGR